MLQREHRIFNRHEAIVHPLSHHQPIIIAKSKRGASAR